MARDTRLLLPVTAVAVVALAVWFGNARLAADVERLEAGKRALLAETARLRERTETLDADLGTIRARKSDLEALRAAGFTAPQDRLAVSEALDALGLAHRIKRLRVSLAPEEAITDRPYTGGIVELVSTPVSITLDAAAEADMLAFLDALPGVFSGVATVETLALRRAGETASAHRPSAMSAQIALRWETVRAGEAP